MSDAAELPADEVTTALAAAGLDALLSGEERGERFTKLGEAAKAAADEATRQGLELLANVASMMLDGDQWDTPYSPWFNFGMQRGMIPSDLTERDLDVLRWVASEVTDVELSARAADLVWLQSANRGPDIPLVRTAIEKWAGQEVAHGSWIQTGRDNLSRAVALGKRINMPEELTQIQRSVLDAIGRTDQAWFVGQGADFLIAQGLIGSRGDDILASLDRAVTELSPELNANELILNSKARLLRGLDRDEEAAAADEAHVEAIISEATRRAADSHMVEAHFLESAYQKARRIPRKWRSARVSDLLASLPSQIREAGEASLDEMSAIESGGDISNEVRIVRDSVRGKSLEDALAAMVGHARFSKFEESKTEAEKSLEGSIMGIIGGSTFASDGRKVDSTEVDNYYGLPSGVWHRMLFFYDIRISLVAVGVVVPAMEVISTEHRINEATLRYLVSSASIVPPHVEQLFALGLYYGAQHEWAAALHLLAPQMEALVRYHLREAGVDTERIDMENSISTETGISTLMKSPEADQIFGPDLAWEIRALLCGPTGPNLRNLVAHGLIGAGVANGPHAIYLWWFAMRLVFIPYYNTLRAERSAAPSESEDAASPETERAPEGGTPDPGIS